MEATAAALLFATWSARAALLSHAVGIVARAPGTPAERAGRLLLDAALTGILLGIEFGGT